MAVAVANAGGVAGAEVAQVYVAPPPVPGLPAPLYSLAAFNKTVALLPGAPPTQLTFSISRGQLTTVFGNGTRGLVPGVFTVWVGGGSPAEGGLLTAQVEFS